MPLSPELLKALSDLGGTALFVLVVIVAALGLYRQWWVPGWLYKQERTARLSAQEEARKLSISVQRLTQSLRDERRRRGSDARR